MFASQLIYTGCGKDRTGAFSVWSKSADITKAEELEIQQHMQYKRMSTLPYEPTKEEIEMIFPKKSSYFFLSTGRVCLAQSVYAGYVYSTVDPRIGNYIIHAFVFDKTSDIIPVNFMESELFKKELTVEEWLENPAPSELPQIDISDYCRAISDSEVVAFFDDERTAWLKTLLQAILNASKNDQKILFYDNHSDLKYWYKALGACLPKSLISDLTYNTFYHASAAMVPGSQISLMDVKIKTIIPGSTTTNVNYKQDILAGKYSFDFSQGIVPTNIAISDYVEAIVNEFKYSVFNAVSLNDAVNDIVTKTGLDLDTALDLHYFVNSQFYKINSITKFELLIHHAQDHYPQSLVDIADNLYQYGFVDENIPFGGTYKNIYKFILGTSEMANVTSLIRQYIINASAFDVDEYAFGSAYYQSFKDNAPFAWSDFFEYLLVPENHEDLEIIGNEYNVHCLVFNTLVEHLGIIANKPDTQKQVAFLTLVRIVSHYIENNCLDEALSFIEIIGSKCAPTWKTWLVEKAYAKLRKDGINLSEACDINFTMSFVEKCGDAELAKKYIKELMLENLENREFVPMFIDHSNEEQKLYMEILKEIKDDEEEKRKYKLILKSIDLYNLANQQLLSSHSLEQCYNEYFLTAEDGGVFPKILEQFLSKQPSTAVVDGYRWFKKLINDTLNLGTDDATSFLKKLPALIASEGASWYENLQKDNLKITKTDFTACVDAICNAIFSVNVLIMIRHIKESGCEDINNLLRCASSDYRAPDYFYVIRLGEGFRGWVTKLRTPDQRERTYNVILDRINKNSVYKFLASEEAYDMFVKDYMGNTFALYIQLTNIENKYNPMFFNGLFAPLHNSKDFAQAFSETLLKQKDYDVLVLVSDIIIYFSENDDGFSASLRDMLAGVMDGMDKRQKKEIAAKVSDIMQKSNISSETQAKVNEYCDEILVPKKEGFFSFFGGKKNKE